MSEREIIRSTYINGRLISQSVMRSPDLPLLYSRSLSNGYNPDAHIELRPITLAEAQEAVRQVSIGHREARSQYPQRVSPYCESCRYFHGEHYGGNWLNCAPYPTGHEDPAKCPDWAKK